MKAIRSTAAGAIVAGNVGCDAEELEPDAVTRARYFVGVNVVLKDGRHAMQVLTPYLHTVTAAERERDLLRETFPQCDVLWVLSTFDLQDEPMRRELAEIDAAIARERSEESFQ